MFAPFAMLPVSAPALWWRSSPSVCLVLMESFCRCLVALLQTQLTQSPAHLCIRKHQLLVSPVTQLTQAAPGSCFPIYPK